MPDGSRVEQRVRRDFPEPGAREIMRVLDELPGAAGYSEEMLGSERVRAAIVLLSHGRLRSFHAAVKLALTDWRDLLVLAGLAEADWPARLDAALGPASAVRAGH